MSLKSLVGGNETQKPWYTKSIMPASIKEALNNQTQTGLKNKKGDSSEKKLKQSKVDKKERKRDLKRQMKELERQILMEKSKVVMSDR